MGNNTECFICGGNSDAKADPVDTSTFFECKTCGKYLRYMYEDNINKDFLASFMYYKCKISSLISDKKYFGLLCQKESLGKMQKKYPNVHFVLVSKQDVEIWYPQTFNEKINTILLGLSKLSKYDGSSIEMTYEQYYSAFFVKRYNLKGSKTTDEERENQIKFIENYLINNNFIKRDKDSFKKVSITLLPEGFKRIDELQKNQSLNSKEVFVAMSFAENTKEVREAIRKAIQDAKYTPIFLDEAQHNNQIVPEMLYQIRQSKFVVAEFTEHNEGAYYEAGYAAGLGKEVIHICRKDSFDKGIHFDIKQINTIIWETEAELTRKLSMRIEATIK